MPAISKAPVSFYDYLAKRNLSEQEVLEWRGIHPGLYTDLPPIDKLPRFSIPREHGVEDVIYSPTRIQRRFHNTKAPNSILEGPRGTGKSVAIRMDAHMWSMHVPGWKYLILRRKLTDLKKNHLLFMPTEMEKLGGRFNRGDNIAYYPNGSVGFFTYCEHLSDVMNLLSSEYGSIYFDEITTFLWDMISKISACARLSEDVAEALGIQAFVKGGTNPLGVGALEVKKYFITKTVQPEEDPEYDPEDYEAIRTERADNPYMDWKGYDKRLGSLQERTRRAWKDGEWVNDGAYFVEWRPTQEGRAWHVIKELPTIRQDEGMVPIYKVSWIRIYRTLDWGFRPDPAVCHWIAVMPNRWAIVFKERSWRETVAKDVALAIKRESEGMHIVETFADPSMFAKRGDATFSIGDIIEDNGVPLTPSVNDRTKFGLAICDWLNTVIEDHPEDAAYDMTGTHPKLQILSGEEYGDRLGCPQLIRTITEVQSDPREPSRLADGGEDHYVVSLAYFCMGDAPPSRNPRRPTQPRWMMSKREFNESFPDRL